MRNKKGNSYLKMQIIGCTDRLTQQTNQQINIYTQSEPALHLMIYLIC